MYTLDIIQNNLDDTEETRHQVATSKLDLVRRIHNALQAKDATSFVFTVCKVKSNERD